MAPDPTRKTSWFRGRSVNDRFAAVLELITSIVWPVIATHLEFKPQSSGPAGSDKEDSSRQT